MFLYIIELCYVIARFSGRNLSQTFIKLVSTGRELLTLELSHFNQVLMEYLNRIIFSVAIELQFINRWK
jgi:hypothetical protein